MSFVAATSNVKNFSFTKLDDNQTLRIPLNQQMIIVGDIELQATSEIIIENNTELVIIEDQL